jgi:hypothetical protein
MRFSSPAVVGLVTLIVYMLNAGPSFFWLDSSEFVAAAWELGVAHAPGHPLPSLLGYLFAQLPIGTIAFRVTLACAVQTALAAAVVTLIAKQLLARLREPSAPTPAPAILAELCAIAAGFVAGLSYALWFQAVRAPRSMRSIRCCCWSRLAWCCAISRPLTGATFSQPRWFMGLALCNHHLLALLALFPILLFIAAIHRAKRSGRLIVAIVAMGMLGLCTLAYLPLRAADNPRANWGNPPDHRALRFCRHGQVLSEVGRARRQADAVRAGGRRWFCRAGRTFAARRLDGAGGLLLGDSSTQKSSPCAAFADRRGHESDQSRVGRIRSFQSGCAWLPQRGRRHARAANRRLSFCRGHYARGNIATPSAGRERWFDRGCLWVGFDARAHQRAKDRLESALFCRRDDPCIARGSATRRVALYVLLRVDLQHLGDANQCWAEAGRHSRASKFFASTRLRGVARQAPPWPEARPFSLAQSGTIASGGVACVARDPTGLARIRSQYSARYRASFATSWADDAAVSASKNRVSPHSRASTRHRALERRHPPHRSSRNHAHAGLDAFSASPFVVRPWTAAVIRLSSAARSAARPTGSSLARVGQSVWLSATEKKRYRKPKNRRENGGWRLDVLGELGEPVSSSTRSPVRAGLRPVSGHFSAVIPCQGGAVYAVNI